MSEFDRFRGSSKAFLVVTLLLCILYAVIVLLRILKVKGDPNVSDRPLIAFTLSLYYYRK